MSPSRVAEALTIATGLLLPRGCAGCGLAGPPACPHCAAGLAGPFVPAALGPTATPGRRGRSPGRRSDSRSDRLSDRPLGHPAGPAPGRDPVVARAVAAATYEGPTRTLLLSYKERGRIDLGRPLGAALARAVAAAAGTRRRARRHCSILLVPVPTAAAARRRRGFDHAARLGSAAAWELTRRGIRARSVPALRLARTSDDQVGLDPAARSRNRSGAFVLGPRARPPAADELAIVVDDIVTTGASMLEALRALRAGGWAPVGAAAVAATPRRHVAPTGPPSAPSPHRDAPSGRIAHVVGR